jgi:hypothetical protein
MEMDFRDIVKNRKNESGTIDDDLLPPQSGANEGDLTPPMVDKLFSAGLAGATVSCA